MQLRVKKIYARNVCCNTWENNVCFQLIAERESRRGKVKEERLGERKSLKEERDSRKHFLDCKDFWTEKKCSYFY